MANLTSPSVSTELNLVNRNMSAIVAPRTISEVLIQHEIAPDIPDSPGDNDKTPDSTIIEAKEITVGALERARFFVQEKAEQTHRTLREIRRNSRRLLTLGSLGIVAATSPMMSATSVEAREPNRIVVAQAPYEVPGARVYNIGTGGYPYAEAPIGSLDAHGYNARECLSYVVWRLEQNGVDYNRIETVLLTPARAEQEFETRIIDTTPAVGSALLIEKNTKEIEKNPAALNADPADHIVYVSAVEEDPEHGSIITVEDYNSNPGGYGYSITKYYVNKLLKMLPNSRFIHFEKPRVAGGIFVDTMYGGYLKNVIAASTTAESYGIGDSTYIKSSNGIHVLLFKDGKFRKYTTNDFMLQWETKSPPPTKKPSQYHVSIEPIQPKAKKAKQTKTSIRKNKLVIWHRGKGTKKIQDASFNIGSATVVKLENNGTIAGYRGKKKVWNAPSLNAAPRIARAAAQREERAAQKRTLATKNHQAARKAYQTKTSTKAKTVNGKLAR